MKFKDLPVGTKFKRYGFDGTECICQKVKKTNYARSNVKVIKGVYRWASMDVCSYMCKPNTEINDKDILKD